MPTKTVHSKSLSVLTWFLSGVAIPPVDLYHFSSSTKCKIDVQFLPTALHIWIEYVLAVPRLMKGNVTKTWGELFNCVLNCGNENHTFQPAWLISQCSPLILQIHTCAMVKMSPSFYFSPLPLPTLHYSLKNWNTNHQFLLPKATTVHMSDQAHCGEISDQTHCGEIQVTGIVYYL